MLLKSFLRSRGPRSRGRRAPARARFDPVRLVLQALEDRAMPSLTPVPSSEFAAGVSPRCVVVGEFNGDGLPDLATANCGPESTVSVMLGNGDGTFQAPRTLAAGSYPFAVSVGDFNGDGRQDLVSANERGKNVSVFLGNGDGTFQAARNYDVGTTPLSMAVGEFNGDGRADLAVAN